MSFSDVEKRRRSKIRVSFRWKERKKERTDGRTLVKLGLFSLHYWFFLGTRILFFPRKKKKDRKKERKKERKPQGKTNNTLLKINWAETLGQLAQALCKLCSSFREKQKFAQVLDT